MDFSKIVKTNKDYKKFEHLRKDGIGLCEASSDFVDNPEVPPLE
jgi:hypothetical protein